MTLIPRLALVTGFALGCTLNAATPVNQVVSENAGVIVAINDVPGLLSKWEGSPWAKTWNDEQMKKFLAPLREQMKIEEWNSIVKEKSGYTLDELLGFATGDAILAVTEIDFNTPGAKDPTILLGVDVGDNQSKIESLLAKDAKENGRREEVAEFAGVSVHTLFPKDSESTEVTVWAVHEGKWLISQSKDAVVAAIDAIKNGGAERPWGRSERFARLNDRAKNPHVALWINPETLYPAFRSAMEAKAAAKKEQQEGGGVPFDEMVLIDALGFDAWRDIYATFSIEDDSTRLNFGVNYSEAKGLLKLLAYKDGPIQQAGWVPESALSVSTAQFSVKEAYGALEQLVQAVSPQVYGMIDSQIRNFNKQLGIDLRRDLIGSLGDNIVSVMMANPAAAAEKNLDNSMLQIVAFKLDDAGAFTNAIEALKRMAGPQAEQLFQTRDYLGEKLITLQTPQAAQTGTPAYSIAKGYFLLSTKSALPVESALQTLAGERPTIWSNAEVRSALGSVPANASSFEYVDMKRMVAFGVDALAMVAKMVGNTGPEIPEMPAEGEAAEGEAAEGTDEEAPAEAEGAEKKLPIDPEAVPDPEVLAKYWSYGWGYGMRESTGMHGSSQIIHPK